MTVKDPSPSPPSSAAFKVGAIALAFLIIGYQAALFMSRAARLRLEANRDHPDTVYVYSPAAPEAAGPGARSSPSFADPSQTSSGFTPPSTDPSRPLAGTPSSSTDLSGGSRPPRTETIRRNASHSAFVEHYRRETRRVETFRFNPNTVSVDDLIRLGFSEKQARAIDNYRAKGGRFRRKADFAKSYVVADSVFRRLEPYISIPRLDLNTADSTALDALPGIGPWFAARIVSYRDELCGYSYPEQLMDIYRFDREKYDALSDLVWCSPPEPYPLWTLPEEELRRHPYIRTRQAARAIILFRENTPPPGRTPEALAATGILPEDLAAKLIRCRIADP